MLYILVVAFSIVAQGYEGPTARVLLDNEKPASQIQGQFSIECLKIKGQKLKVTPCKRVSKKNRLNDISFKAGWFHLETKKGRLRLRLSSGRIYKKFYAQAIRFTGKIEWQGHHFEQLDLLLDQEKEKWIAYIPLERYLMGVLSSEVPARWPLDALKAQAIASRSYFMFKRGQSSKFYDVRSDHMDQVFKMQKAVSPNIIKAVDETRDVVLAHTRDQKIFPTYFHSDCGGQTSTENSVWRKPASENQPVLDSPCSIAPRNNWKFEISKHRLQAVLQQKFILPRRAKLKGIFPRGPKGSRAHKVDFLFSHNLIKTMNANEFRKLLGFGKLKSTQFKVSENLYSFAFAGRGFGHGVGMCQWGAKRWAKMGKSFEDILQHYYPTALLTTIEHAPLRLADAENKK